MTTVTRWWFVRHAPVPGMQGRLYGSSDVACDEKSLQNAVKISPRLEPLVEIKYDDDKIILDFPKELYPTKLMLLQSAVI